MAFQSLTRRLRLSLRCSSSEAFGQVSTGQQHWPPRVRLRGLPFSASEVDICDFFEGFKLQDTPRGRSPVEIIRRTSDGLPTGHAFVYFNDWEEACRARELKQRAYIGSRWIEIYVDWSPESE
eukprot:TRINITY_DN25577_c0_g1_i2.p1 TRINITY_DN25577_c0_g1~~TRINITY_DN25577_c0_g1_i2.p1  ORF type:complete len:123 (+),score=15.10 TRINITY_DN25577_c0_g1_i2:50-418(+)